MGQAPLRRFLAAWAAVIVVLVVLAGPAVSHHPAGWHWRRAANPYTVRVLDSVTPLWQEDVEGAARTWTRRSRAINLAIEKSTTRLSKRIKCQAPDGAVRICNADYGPTDWAAITKLVLNGQHIVRAKIKLNDRDAHASRALACHELGHALGLAHRPQAEESSCLTPFVEPTQRHPDDHDIAQLASIYKHADGVAAQAADTGAAEIAAHDRHLRITRRGDLTILHFRTPRPPTSSAPR